MNKMLMMKKRTYHGEDLKLWAMWSMLIDHAGAVLIENTSLYQITGFRMLAVACRLIGRISFPLICFLLIEGFCHTKDRRKYLIDVDCHHTIEDTGIVLGQAIQKALGEKKGIKRYGHFLLPMDETLALCAIDLSGRPYLNYDASFTTERIGEMDTEMIREFFYAVSYSAAMNLHLKILDGINNHHMAEALFKAFGKALDMAVMEEPRMKDVWSTKGTL